MRGLGCWWVTRCRVRRGARFRGPRTPPELWKVAHLWTLSPGCVTTVGATQWVGLVRRGGARLVVAG